MGRRLFFVLGMVLLVACGPVRALGAQGVLPGPAEPPLSASPLDADPADDPSPLPPARDAVPAAVGLTPVADDEPDPKAPAARPGPRAATEDPEVERVQAAAPALGATPPAAAPASAPAGDRGFLQPSEQLKLGKHEALVSVEVLAPAEMNVNRQYTTKIVVANSGSSDAYNVVVRDELPPGLKFVSSSISPEQPDQPLLTWRLGTVPAGTTKAIVLQVTPTQVAHMDHAATVSFQAGSKARSLVREPKLKVEVVQSPSIPKQLKGKSVVFKISVTNTGDGPAKNVMVLAKLSPGLGHENMSRNDQNSLEHPIDGLGPGERFDLPPLEVEAKAGGVQACKVTASSPDVVFNAVDAEVERSVEVVEPKLKIVLDAPSERFTGTVAPYAVTIANPGTAPAKNVQVSVSLPVSGRLLATPPGAVRDKSRLLWTIQELAPGEAPRKLEFDVRMGDVGFYEVTAEAQAENVPRERDKRSTDVKGMADLDMIVNERRRVVDVKNETTFLITIQNYGTKEANNVQVEARVSPNMQITETSGGPEGTSEGNKEGTSVRFPKIERIAPNGKVLLGIKVRANELGDGIGICNVSVNHDDLKTALQGMANVKVTEGRRTADASDPGAR